MIILGSSSRYRKIIMDQLGYDYTIVSPNIDEKSVRDTNPEELVKKISRAKSKAIREKISNDAIIITADQVISFNGEIREKPLSEEQAQLFFKTYHLNPIETINGLTVINTKTRKSVTALEKSFMTIKKISDNDIAVLSKDPSIYTCAGGIQTENSLFKKYLIENTGSDDSLYGLPKDLTKKLIEHVSTESWYEGTVLSGQQVGRTMTYPTTNLEISLMAGREEGVYAAFVQFADTIYKAALYFGPDYLKTTTMKVLEIHIFNFSQDIYGKSVSFQIGKFIREPVHISNKEDMQEQIKNDIQEINTYFTSSK